MFKGLQAARPATSVERALSGVLGRVLIKKHQLDHRGMSALPLIADMFAVEIDVR